MTAVVRAPAAQDAVGIFHVASFHMAPDVAGHGVMEVLLTLFNQAFLDRGIYQGSEDWPTFFDIFTIIQEYSRTGRMPGAKRDWVFSTSRIVKQLSMPPLAYSFNIKKKVLLEKVFERNVVLELDTLADSQKKFFVETFLLWRFFYRMATVKKREQLLGSIIAEEAHHLFSKKSETLGLDEPINEKILRMCRELGDALVLIDQNPSFMSIVPLSNSGVKISMNLGAESDIRAMSNSMILTGQDKTFLGRLPVGSGIVKLSHKFTENSFLVKFPFVPIQKGSITDEMLQERAKKRLSELMALQPEPVISEYPEISQGDKYKENITQSKPKPSGIRAAKRLEHQEALLLDVLENPESCMSDRSLRLGASTYMFHGLKEALEKEGLVTSEPGKTEQGRPTKILKLTETGREEALRLKQKEPEQKGANRFGGSDHQKLIDEAAQEARKLGYRYIGTEVPLGSGKAADLVVERDGKKVAVEAETGKSKIHIVENVRKNLRHFDEVWSVPKDEVIFGRTKSYFERAGIDFEVGELGGKKMFKVKNK